MITISFVYRSKNKEILKNSSFSVEEGMEMSKFLDAYPEFQKLAIRKLKISLPVKGGDDYDTWRDKSKKEFLKHTPDKPTQEDIEWHKNHSIDELTNFSTEVDEDDILVIYWEKRRILPLKSLKIEEFIK